ncbi:tyrosine--tRNA ligase [Kytococcus sedentarius]|uniref:tyrosine--tRNA ligase n=1 Tax=Kytococcus sedentarius TaxID=1276 RepID=UPI0035BC2B81
MNAQTEPAPQQTSTSGTADDAALTGVLQELQWRGVIAQSTDLQELDRMLAAGPVRFYIGFDPTAPSLHVGSLVQLVTMRRLQEAGHVPVVLVGGSTGLIGDPRPTSERNLHDRETVAGWVDSIAAQVRPFVHFEGENAATVVNNLDWFGQLGALDFLRDVGKHFRVNQMLKKDAVSARLESSQGISYTEFSYQILQGYDFWHLFTTEGVRLQLGGQDQWGNLMAGVDYVHRVEGESVHALTTPLVTEASGRKFGKSEGNAIWLDGTMTSPWTFHQFWLNAEDEKVGEYLRLFTLLDRERIEELEQQVAEAPFKRAAQRALAREMTTLVHGTQTTDGVEAAAEALFGKGDLQQVDPKVLLDATAELAGGEVAAGTSWIDVVVAVGFADSRKAAKRLLGEGGISVNGQRISDPEGGIAEDDFIGGEVAVVKRGRKTLAAARRSG